jgi:hypothetical protein
MKKRVDCWAVMILAIFPIIILSASFATSAPFNVALGKDVELNGVFFEGGWGGGAIPASTVVDGAFLPRSTQWDQGVWWDTRTSKGEAQYIEIELEGIFRIESFIVQADDNDAYKLFYKDLVTDAWILAYDMPAVGGWGLQTRPNPSSSSERYTLAVPIITDELMIKGDLGDGYYSVSEVQAFGTPVPEPVVMVLLGSGLIGLVGFRRKFKR